MNILAIVFVAVLSFASSEDDGRYRPAVNAYYGNYRLSGDGRYNNPFGRYNNYFTNNAQYPYKPYQELLTPHTTNSGKNAVSNNPAQVSVTYRPTTAKPTVTTPVYSLATKSAVKPTALPEYLRSNFAEGNARIVTQDSDIDMNNYRFSYLTDNGISAGETGVVEPTENGGGTRVTGFYEYIGDNGIKYRVDYTADENGFHATGAHLP